MTMKAFLLSWPADPPVEDLLSLPPSPSHETSLANLKEVIALVRDLPPAPPAVRVFQVTRGKSSLPDVTTAHLRLHGNVLALGCEDSSIHLFPVIWSSRSLKGYSYNFFSRCSIFL